MPYGTRQKQAPRARPWRQKCPCLEEGDFTLLQNQQLAVVNLKPFTPSVVGVYVQALPGVMRANSSQLEYVC